ncbi:protein YLS7-like [Hibiscus syriacus]|uniref:Protein YLS7-like n=1 Tax=Hibiscus syriacus TaxID=106335 RepID=A0A6A3A8B0_HIBSY|nr:gibberellin 2-beta-dioxygenase 6-like [Hibiscus syriacus]KAE8700196.1 protein YLS7-like [Hibiscus syriacus]
MSNLESYPPLFRHLSGSSADLTNSMEDSYSSSSSSSSVPIPVVDLQCLSHKKLGEACKEWGVFRLVNHGIPPTLSSKLEEHVRMLFSLSFESKQALLTKPLSYFWGTPVLTPSGAALRGALNMNWLEGINVPLTQLPLFQTEDPRLQDFRHYLEEYGRHLWRIATTLFEAMVKNLNLCPEQTECSLDESTGFVRLYRYPFRSSVDKSWGMMEHTDSSLLSIVNQDQVGGLEIFKDNKWLVVNPISDTLLVHIGDMMQAISDDQYMSVKHRVRVNKQEERLSVCYFVFPEKGSVVHSSKYKPFTYTEFQQQVQNDTNTLGYKVGLQRFKLNAPV